MRVLDLFSGIGGFSLGLERAGMRTVAFCEMDPFCRQVLARHWPAVPCYNDIRTLSADRLRADGIFINAICGGFPCQDVSEANTGGAGLEGLRSGLWSEYRRLIGELRPDLVVVENVSALLSRGLGTVLGDLAALGYDAEWHCIPASAIGAPHERDRLWIVAYPAEGERRPLDFSCDRMAWSDAISPRQEGPGRFAPILEAAWGDDPIVVADALSRMDDGLRIRLDGFNGCANAVVPQIPEIIGRAIMTAIALSDPHPDQLARDVVRDMGRAE